MKNNQLKYLPCEVIVILKRNPQYLTPKQMDSLKKSIKKDGFCAPILVRPLRGGKKYEVVSGNHRFMAAQELGIIKIPCIISNMTKKAAQRLAINLNTIHGEPNVELMAPFLAELDIDTLKEIHLERAMKDALMDYDEELSRTLKTLDIPETIDRESPRGKNVVCKCPKCGRIHMRSKNEKA